MTRVSSWERLRYVYRPDTKHPLFGVNICSQHTIQLHRPPCIPFVRPPHLSKLEKNEWELFTGQLGSVAGVSEAGRPRGFPPWASPDREEAFGLLAEYLPHLVQSADLADAER